MTDWLDSVKEILPPAVGAALAAVRQPHQGAIERLIGFFVGFFSALWLTGPFIDFFHLNSLTYSGGVSFSLGFFAMTISDAITGADWKGILKDRLTK
jgi:hypothetical protein